MFRNLEQNFKEESRQSYLGMLKHGSTHRIEQGIKKSDLSKEGPEYIIIETYNLE